MKKIVLLLTLGYFFGFINVNAANIFYVNATQFNVSLTVVYLVNVNVDCRGFTIDLAPGQVHRQDPGPCRLDEVSAIVYKTVGRARIHSVLTNVNRGMIAIRPNGLFTFEISEPRQEAGGGKGRIYLVNATGYKMSFLVDYPSLFCREDKGSLEDGDIANLHVGTCFNSIVRGDIHTEHGTIRVNAPSGTLGTANGTYVFRRRNPTRENASPFEVVGPFKE